MREAKKTFDIRRRQVTLQNKKGGDVHGEEESWRQEGCQEGQSAEEEEVAEWTHQAAAGIADDDIARAAAVIAREKTGG
ncbi:MAG: hypothetical protein AMXMBFR13_23700 [Phycisphaerae bacterium]|jgi:hypothetical protein